MEFVSHFVKLSLLEFSRISGVKNVIIRNSFWNAYSAENIIIPTVLGIIKR